MKEDALAARARVDDLADKIAVCAARIDAAMHELLTYIRQFDTLKGWAKQGAESCAHWHRAVQKQLSHSDGAASPRPALLLLKIAPLFFVVAPWPRGASPPSVRTVVSLRPYLADRRGNDRCPGEGARRDRAIHAPAD